MTLPASSPSRMRCSPEPSSVRRPVREVALQRVGIVLVPATGFQREGLPLAVLDEGDDVAGTGLVERRLQARGVRVDISGALGLRAGRGRGRRHDADNDHHHNA